MATAKDTKMQENGSRVFFEQLIEKNKEASVNFIEDKAYPNMPAIWYQYYQLQGKALKKYLGNQRGYLYSRDEGIMPFLEKAARDMGVSTKDKWNPMDIVMVKKSNESKIMKSVEKILAENIEKEAKLDIKGNLIGKIIDENLEGTLNKEYKILQDYTLRRKLTIGDTGILVIPNGLTLTVPKDSLTIKKGGVIIISGKIINAENNGMIK